MSFKAQPAQMGMCASTQKSICALHPRETFWRQRRKEGG